MLSTTLYLSVFGLFSLALAAPTSRAALPRFKRQDLTLDPPDITDADAWCNNLDLSDPTVVSAIWETWGISILLDDYLANGGGADNWVVNMANEIIPNAGNTGAYGCGIEGHPQYYYIFTAVKNMQAVFQSANDNLQDAVISDILKIDVISSQFEVDIPAMPGIPSWMLSALNVGASAAGLIPGAGSSLGEGLSLLGEFAGNFETGDDTTATPDSGAMSAALDSVFETMRTGLENTLALAVGGEGDYNTLPNQGTCFGETCASPIAGFMSNGKFLLQGEDIDGMFTEGFPLFQKKLVDIAISTAGYELAVYTEDYDVFCSVYPGHYYIDTDLGSRCVVLTAPGSEGQGDAGDQIGIMEQDYGFDMIDYYTASWDCFYAGYPSIDMSSLPSDGSLPTCFYNGTIISGNDGALPS